LQGELQMAELPRAKARGNSYRAIVRMNFVNRPKQLHIYCPGLQPGV